MSRATALTIVMLLLLFHCSLFAARPGAKQTDASLLEDLGADLLGPSPVNSKVLRDLSLTTRQPDEGNDNWLAQVVQHMQYAQSLLERQGETDRASSAQSQAIDSLDTMIAELTQRQSQCKGGQSKPSSQPKPSTPKSGKTGSSPTTSATPTTSQSGDLASSLENTGELVKDLWGHLPERQRQQILQPLSEEFLPKYSAEIEEYFRTMADPDRRPTESP